MERLKALKAFTNHFYLDVGCVEVYVRVGGVETCDLQLGTGPGPRIRGSFIPGQNRRKKKSLMFLSSDIDAPATARVYSYKITSVNGTVFRRSLGVSGLWRRRRGRPEI